jgi:Predicted permease
MRGLKVDIKLSGIIRWIVGLLFIVTAVSVLAQGHILAFIFSILIAVVCIPVIAEPIERKINVSMSGPIRFILVFVLLISFGVVAPQTTSTQNNTQVAAPPVDTHTSSVDVPTTTNISNATSSSNATPISTVTSNNKGTLDITTSPAGATITVDGVSEGVSPIEGLSVDAGTHSVTVYLSGYDPQKEKVEVANSETKKLFYTLVPEADKNTASTSTQEKTQTPEVAATSESSNYQDAQWLVTFTTDSTIVANDMNYVSSAVRKNDYTSLSIYANSLFTDSQKAMDDNDLYSVSPDLQGTKDEYRLAMVQANWAAYYISTGINDFNNGNVQAATSDFNQATQNMKSCGEHANNATKLLTAYNSKKS